MTREAQSESKHANTLLLQCPVCVSDDAETIGVAGAMSPSLAATVILVCGNCEAVYLSPVPSDQGDAPESDDTYKRVFDPAVRQLKQLVPSATKVLVADVDEISTLKRDPVDGRFDHILVPLTLEGSKDPSVLMQHLAALLEDDGKLEIVCGNPGSSSFGWFGGRHWCGYRYPNTRQQLGLTSLQQLAEQAGLLLNEHRTLSAPSSWLISARNALVDWQINRALRAVLTGPWLVPWLFAWLLESVAVMRGRGSVLTIRLVKSDGKQS